MFFGIIFYVHFFIVQNFFCKISLWFHRFMRSLTCVPKGLDNGKSKNIWYSPILVTSQFHVQFPVHFLVYVCLFVVADRDGFHSYSVHPSRIYPERFANHQMDKGSIFLFMCFLVVCLSVIMQVLRIIGRSFHWRGLEFLVSGGTVLVDFSIWVFRETTRHHSIQLGSDEAYATALPRVWSKDVRWNFFSCNPNHIFRNMGYPKILCTP